MQRHHGPLEIAAAIEGLDAWPSIAAGDFERAMMALHTKDSKDSK